MALEIRALDLTNGGKLYFEQDTDHLPGSYKAGLGDAMGQVDFAAALETTKRAAKDLVEAIVSVVSPPASCELTFGLKLSTEAGFIVAKAHSEANFKVKVVWPAGERG